MVGAQIKHINLTENCRIIMANIFLLGAIDDFSGPATSNRFPLGSILHIMASVEQNRHQPLLLLLEECVAANAPEIQPETNLYPIITNKGYFQEKKKALI